MKEKIPYHEIEESYEHLAEVRDSIKELNETGSTLYKCDFRQCNECGDWFLKRGNRTKCSDYCKSSARKKIIARNMATYKERTKALPYCYAKIKRQAEERGIDFNLTEAEYSVYHGKECYYCGDWVKFGSLDRVDSLKPYEVGNVVACCGVCNRSKFHAKYVDFIEWANKIAKRHPVDVS